MEDARKVLGEVKEVCKKQRSVSRKDEVTVMKAMLNDKSFSVGVYDKTGKVGEYNPAEDARKMLANVVATTTRISSKEAEDLVSNYEFTKSDATTMVNVSKEFINTYLPTGRKLALGGRETSDIKLLWKNIAEKTTGVPSKGSKDRSCTVVPAHDGIKVFSPCPAWLKK